MKGQTVLEKSGILGASEIGIAAAAGIDTVTVYKMPRVGVLSTGNEVCMQTMLCDIHVSMYIYQ